MSMPVTPALAQFEMHKDDPVVQGLQAFILLTLHKSLSQVLHWNITYTHGKDTCPFTLELVNGSQIEGVLHRQDQSPDFTFRQAPWKVVDDWKYTF